MTRAALCFPGQGSQVPGMAEGLLDEPIAYRLLEVAASEGLDLAAALVGDADALRPTDVAQPAIVFTELVLTSMLPADLVVVGVAGHSVGEYGALAAAGAYTPEQALRLVIRRGRAMAAMTEGTMAAVIGLDDGAVSEACAEVRHEGEVVVVANRNAPGQAVISGSVAGVAAATALVRERGARRVLPLNVSGAFHSPLMEAAAERFGAELDANPPADASVPVACNADGALVTRADDLAARLRRQLTAPVLWVDCVSALVSLGVDLLVEVGPGAVLSGLARRIVPGVGTANVSSPASATPGAARAHA